MTEGMKSGRKAAIRGRGQARGSQTNALPLEQELLQLADGLAEYSAINAFLCRSFAAVLSADDAAGEDVIQGAKYFSDFLQHRVRELRYGLELVRER